MSTEVAKLHAKISADVSGFETGMQKVKSGLGDAKTGLTGLPDMLRAVATTMGVIGLSAAVKYGLALNQIGAQADRLKRAFGDLAAFNNANADELVEALKKASRGTIAETDLMLVANRAMMLGIGADSEKLASLMEVASFRGRAMGLSTEQAFSDIVTGIGRMSPMILDNLGIVIDADQTFAAYAETLGKAAGELTDIEKKQALLNRVLAEGQGQIAAAGGIKDDDLDKLERFGAAKKDLLTAGGEFVSTAIAPDPTAMTDAMRDATEALKIETEFRATEAAAAPAGGPRTQQELNAALQLLGQQAAEGQIDRYTYMQAVIELQRQFQEFQETLKNPADGLGDPDSEVGKYIKQMGEKGAVPSGMVADTTAMREAMESVKSSTDKLDAFGVPLPVTVVGGAPTGGPEYASGGYVGWGLPRGTPISATVHAGEVVLNERQQRERMERSIKIGNINVYGVQDARGFLAELEALRSNQTG